jgi:four helix bundle protein
MTKIQNTKLYDLEERTFQFAKNTALYIKQLQRNISNIEYGEQVVGSSGSVGSNYIEANEALSKKDFMMRIKICRKEAKESAYWLRLILETNEEKYRQGGQRLLNEALELKKIFSSILIKSE